LTQRGNEPQITGCQNKHYPTKGKFIRAEKPNVTRNERKVGTLTHGRELGKPIARKFYAGSTGITRPGWRDNEKVRGELGKWGITVSGNPKYRTRSYLIKTGKSQAGLTSSFFLDANPPPGNRPETWMLT